MYDNGRKPMAIYNLSYEVQNRPIQRISITCLQNKQNTMKNKQLQMQKQSFFYEMTLNGVQSYLTKFYPGKILTFRKCIIRLEYVFLRENILVYVGPRENISVYIFSNKKGTLMKS